MAEDEDEDDQEAGGGEEEGGEAPQKGGKKVLIIIVLAFLLVVGGLAAAYFTGLMDPVIEMIIGKEATSGGEDGEEEEATEGRAVFYDLQEILVNLNTGGRKSSFLKIRVALELETSDDIAKIESVMSRIVDNFQTYLRELRIDDLKGSAGMYRLREELLVRVNAAASPAKIKDVLFKEMLVQ